MSESPLRCAAKLHGVLDTERNSLRVKCDSRWCGHEPGTVVIHEFDLASGEVTTHKYKDTPALAGNQKGQNHG